MNLAVSNPNFSIVVPTGCNASCKFCFWKPSKNMLDSAAYLKRLSEVLYDLPAEFEQCSITGGEPTMLPWLEDILKLTRKRFKKIVLSSNGYQLRKVHLELIDHLNISRHHYEQSQNDTIFGTKMPGFYELSIISMEAEKVGVDVTLNCVLSSDFRDDYFIHKYIDFAKSVYANSVAFRKEHSDLLDIPVEGYLKSKILSDFSCPVCRTKIRNYKGMKTSWKYSVSEPSDVIDGIYELIMQPDGKLTEDWAGNKVYKLSWVDTFKLPVSVPRGNVSMFSGCCGGSGSGCGSWERKITPTCEVPSGCGAKPLTISCGSSGCG